MKIGVICLLFICSFHLAALDLTDICQNDSIPVDRFNELLGIAQESSFLPVGSILKKEDQNLVLEIDQTCYKDHSRTYYSYNLNNENYQLLSDLVNTYNFTYYIDVNNSYQHWKWMCGLHNKNPSIIYGKMEFDRRLEKVYTPTRDSPTESFDSRPPVFRVMQSANSPARILSMYPNYNLERLVPNHNVKYITRLGFNLSSTQFVPQQITKIKVIIHHCQEFSARFKFGKENFLFAKEISSMLTDNEYYDIFYQFPTTNDDISRISVYNVEVYSVPQNGIVIKLPLFLSSDLPENKLFISTTHHILNMIRTLEQGCSKLEYYIDMDDNTYNNVRKICGLDPRDWDNYKENIAVLANISESCHNITPLVAITSSENHKMRLHVDVQYNQLNLMEINNDEIVKRHVPHLLLGYLSKIQLSGTDHQIPRTINIMCLDEASFPLYIYYPESCDLINSAGIYNLLFDQDEEFGQRQIKKVPIDVLPVISGDSGLTFKSLYMIYKSNASYEQGVQQANVNMFSPQIIDDMLLNLRLFTKSQINLAENVTIQLLFRVQQCSLTSIVLSGMNVTRVLERMKKYKFVQTNTGLLMQREEEDVEFLKDHVLSELSCTFDSPFPKILEITPQAPSIEIRRLLKSC